MSEANERGTTGDAPTARQNDVDLEDRRVKGAVSASLFGTEAAPVRVGRFTIVKRLGAGGMGVVYTAYDDELERKVAIKLLREEAMPGSEGRARLVREAQAMARLSHPNVVPVFEVGTHGGQVFLAMEYVKGQPLGAWLSAEPRSVGAIVDVFTQAGRGLAAAHAAGIIHRDFKPDNVLVGNDGRVRVADFGLARPPSDEEVTTEPVDPRDDTSHVGGEGLLGSPLTQTGAVIGTPAYMAPEQYTAQAIGPFTDQFSFCVALYEALYGTRPFSGETRKELSLAVIRGQIDSAPPDATVPTWIRPILLRGLSLEPTDRFPDMDALLEALGSDPAARRRRWALGLSVGALVAGSLGTAAWIVVDASQLASCKPADQRLAGIWDDSSRQAIADVHTEAGDAWQAVAGHLDGYVADWRAAYNQACEIEDPADDDARELVTQHRRCLDWCLTELGALMDQLALPDAPIAALASRGHEVAEDRRQPRRCIEIVPLQNQSPPAPNAALPEVTAVRLEIRRLWMQASEQAPSRSIEQAKALLERARATGYGPVEVEAVYAVGILHYQDRQEAVAWFQKAAQLAEVERNDRWLAWSALKMARILYKRGQAADAASWLRRVEGAIERLGGDPRLEAEVLRIRAELRLQGGQVAEALPLVRQRVELLSTLLGPDSREAEGARRWLLDVEGRLEVAQTNLDELLANVQRAVERMESQVGPNHRQLVYPLRTLTLVHIQRQEKREALRHAERALTIAEALPEHEHQLRGAAHDALGQALAGGGRWEEAAQHFQSSMDAFEAAGSDEKEIADTVVFLASTHQLLGQPQKALEVVIRLQERLEHESSGAELESSTVYGVVVAVRARALIDLERPREAIPLAEKGIEILSTSDDPTYFAVGCFTRYTLARALAESGQDVTRSRTLAREAQACIAQFPRHPFLDAGKAEALPHLEKLLAE